jgi:hypothetical protein
MLVPFWRHNVNAEDAEVDYSVPVTGSRSKGPGSAKNDISSIRNLMFELRMPCGSAHCTAVDQESGMG